jgi:hypothetical protein
MDVFHLLQSTSSNWKKIIYDNYQSRPLWSRYEQTLFGVFVCRDLKVVRPRKLTDSVKEHIKKPKYQFSSPNQLPVV